MLTYPGKPVLAASVIVFMVLPVNGTALNDTRTPEHPRSSNCLECHTDSHVAGHPDNVIPSIPVPKELPLDKNGRLTCNTCHDTSRISSGFMRTTYRGLEFCQLCHTTDFFISMKDQGLSLLTAIHPLQGNPADVLEVGFPDDLAMDESSVQCLACHADDNDSYYKGTHSHSRTINRSDNHPVGLMYASLESYGGYRPAELLPDNILLPGGRLGCISCHKGFSRNHGSLVVTNEQSGLCNSCHML